MRWENVEAEADRYALEELRRLDWESRVLGDALLRMEAVLVKEFGQPTGGSLLAVAHRGIRIAFRRTGAFYDYLKEHPELKAVLGSNPVPPLEWEREGLERRDARVDP